MTSLTFALHPRDTLFFRDGSPFNQDDAGLAEARSVFPPYPEVTTGAVRAALARAMGWVGWDNWRDNEDLQQALGDGRSLGSIRFRGPFLGEFDPVGFRRLWLPMSAGLVGKALDRAEMAKPDKHGNDGWALQRLVPMPQCFESDAGAKDRVWFANKPDDDDLQPRSDHWLRQDWFAEALAVDFKSATPNAGVRRLISDSEMRIGLERGLASHQADDGKLYAASRQRLHPEFGLIVQVEETEGANLKIDSSLPAVVPLGGDGGFAYLDRLPDDPLSAVWHEINRHAPADGGDGWLYYTVVLLTPALANRRDFREPFKGLPGECVFVAHERLLRIGGWSAGHGPQSTRAAYPAGSMFFCRKCIDGGTSAQTLHAELNALRQRGLGEDAGFGYGGFAHGAWQPNG